jgi:protein-S-isoprenylcysteine O-methyltransferase Ste14/uncharacterized membrane protein (UPF0127 family)
MAIINITRDTVLGCRVVAADTPISRLVGLLGTQTPAQHSCVYFVPCTALHTFGMKYPVDAVFLDRRGKVVALLQNMRPNRISRIYFSAHSALEFPAHTFREDEIQIGDQLKIEIDGKHHDYAEGLKRIFHGIANITIALLWAAFVMSSYLHWQENGRITSLGLVCVNSLLCFLFLTRRQSTEISHHLLDWIIPLCTIGFSLSLRPGPGLNTSLTTLSVTLQVTGIIAALLSLSNLGRSFGIVPANRGIKNLGPYRIVRHPLYASEIIFYIGFLVGNMSTVNLSLVLLIMLGQVYRAFSEERLLARENIYSEYMQRVRYRLLPRVF